MCTEYPGTFSTLVRFTPNVVLPRGAEVRARYITYRTGSDVHLSTQGTQFWNEKLKWSLILVDSMGIILLVVVAS